MLHLIANGPVKNVESVSLTDARVHLRALVEKAAAGRPVCITRRRKPVAQITALRTPRRAIDPVALYAITSLVPAQEERSGTFMRVMRDEERY